jgi:glycosyltransferase involved in cell wall biosynthesis
MPITLETRPLHVAMILPTYLPESFGGAEQQSRKLCEALEQLGVRVTVLAPRLHARTPARESHGRTAIERLRVRRAPNLGGRHLGSFLAWSAKLTWWLYAHRHRYDVIHVIHGRLHAVPAAFAGHLLGKPIVVKLGRGGDHFDLAVVRNKRLGGPMFSRLIERYTTAFVANSREIAGDLQAIGIPDSRIHRLPNGVELPATGERQRDQVFGTAPVRFLYFGRLDPEKDLDRMIRGFAALGAGPRARLTIVGEGACRAGLIGLVASLGLEAHVEFLPPVSDVSRLLRDADFHVSTSLSEGMSNALLEALSWGVPAVVSRVSGVDDIVVDGVSGLVFEPGDDRGYVSALEAAMAMTDQAWQSMSQSAADTARRLFAIDMVAERHVDLYSRLLQRRQEATA